MIWIRIKRGLDPQHCIINYINSTIQKFFAGFHLKAVAGFQRIFEKSCGVAVGPGGGGIQGGGDTVEVISRGGGGPNAESRSWGSVIVLVRNSIRVLLHVHVRVPVQVQESRSYPEVPHVGFDPVGAHTVGFGPGGGAHLRFAPGKGWGIGFEYEFVFVTALRRDSVVMDVF
jgi:hypothetical protein